MEPTITLRFTLPVSDAEKVLTYVRSLGQGSSAVTVAGQAMDVTLPSVDPPEVLSFEPVFKSNERRELRYLLDDRLTRVLRFIVNRGGNFYNDELAGELGIPDAETSNPLGHITRKLRKTGVDAGGFRGHNWYSKMRSSGRTLIKVREDVLNIFRRALGL